MILATGGTIGNTVDGRLSIGALLADIERAHPDDHPRIYNDIEVEEVLRIGAESFTPSDWQRVGQAVSEAVESEEVDGVVVTHGTFTAEVTAYFLHLTINTTKPIVVACSQRKHATVGNDGDRNLIDAVRVASDPAAHDLGVVVVLNEEIHSAREVTKTSRRPSGFRSDHSGILGTVSEDGIFLYRRPVRRHTRDSEFRIPPGDLPRVDIVATYAGADGTAVDAFRQAGARGLVVNGFSYSGKPHEHQRPSLERAVDTGISVVLVNRGGDGRMPIPVEPDGFVRGDNLTAQKARVLLAVALTTTNETTELQRIFTEY
jgi:L-asparaginase